MTHWTSETIPQLCLSNGQLAAPAMYMTGQPSLFSAGSLLALPPTCCVAGTNNFSSLCHQFHFHLLLS